MQVRSRGSSKKFKMQGIRGMADKLKLIFQVVPGMEVLMKLKSQVKKQVNRLHGII